MDLDWEGLARPSQTIVVYMGLKGLPVLARELIAHGLPAATPAMIVEQGTTPSQRVLVAALATLPKLAAEQAIRAPTLIIVGDVVRVRASLPQIVAQTPMTRALAG
jgi:uroporphyrin-III C-methyltransferase/precorrin-2 dehydrogenase/sirohydrochlorin ferrochelatase